MRLIKIILPSGRLPAEDLARATLSGVLATPSGLDVVTQLIGKNRLLSTGQIAYPAEIVVSRAEAVVIQELFYSSEAFMHSQDPGCITFRDPA